MTKELKKKEDVLSEAENSGKIDRVILEVLLDIRDALGKKKK